MPDDDPNSKTRRSGLRNTLNDLRGRFRGKGGALEARNWFQLVGLGLLGFGLLCLLILLSIDGFQYLIGRRCRYMLVDVGAETGEELVHFAKGGGAFGHLLQEKGIRPNSFCVDAFELHNGNIKALRNLEKELGNNFTSLRVHYGKTVSDFKGQITYTETQRTSSSSGKREMEDGTVVYNLKEDLSIISQPRIAPVEDLVKLFRKRRVKSSIWSGLTFARIRSSLSDAPQFLRLFLANSEVCEVLDTLVLEVKDTDDVLAFRNIDLKPHDIVVDLQVLSKILTDSSGCSTKVTILNNLHSTVGKDNAVLYAVAVRENINEESLCAGSGTWMRQLPHGDIAIFLRKEVENRISELRCLGGHVGVFFKQASAGQTVFHSRDYLTRLKLSWDMFMKERPELEYLVFVKDDSFVVSNSVSKVLRSCLDPGAAMWAGLLEKPPVDIGLGSRYAHTARTRHTAAGGQNCQLEGEAQREGEQPCKETICTDCPDVPVEGFVVLTRGLLESLIHHLDDCTAAASLPDSNGLHVLYGCIQQSLGEVHAKSLRGIYTDVWPMENQKEDSGINAYPLIFQNVGANTAALHTGAVPTEFEELDAVIRVAERRTSSGSGDPYLTIDDLHHHITCNGRGYFRNGICYGKLGAIQRWCEKNEYTWDPFKTS